MIIIIKNNNKTTKINTLLFSDVFNVDEKVIKEYGCVNLDLVHDLKLFIDPFLLINSDNSDYRNMHDQIIKYLFELRKMFKNGVEVDKELLLFHEVKQNWFGYSCFGNQGRGLGKTFSKSLSEILKNDDIFLLKKIKNTHLEKLLFSMMKLAVIK